MSTSVHVRSRLRTSAVGVGRDGDDGGLAGAGLASASGWPGDIGLLRWDRSAPPTTSTATTAAAPSAALNMDRVLHGPNTAR